MLNELSEKVVNPPRLKIQEQLASGELLEKICCLFQMLGM